MLHNDIYLLIALRETRPSLYLNLQLASKSFYLYLKSLSHDRKREIRQHFARLRSKFDWYSAHFKEYYVLPNGNPIGLYQEFDSSIYEKSKGCIDRKKEQLLRRFSICCDAIHGLSEEFWDNGQLAKRCYYDHGKLIMWEEAWDRDGHQIV